MTLPDPARLENLFHQDMLAIYTAAKRELHYNANYFLGMLSDIGGLKTAKKLIRASNVSDGFAFLWEHQRLDLSVEVVVLQAKYAPLFSDEERAIARDRLEQYGYSFPA